MADQAADTKQVVLQACSVDLLNDVVNFQAVFGSSVVSATVRQDDVPGVTDNPKKAVADFLQKIVGVL